MKLITEVYTEDCEVLTESTENGKKNYFIEGIFMQGDLQNRNGRIYPSAILEKEMKRYEIALSKQKELSANLATQMVHKLMAIVFLTLLLR